jgi:transposase-like protein
VALSEEDRPTDVKFKVVESLDKNTIEKTLTESIKPNSMVVTDGYKGFSGLSKIGFEHVPFTMQTPKDNQAYLPWVHILISNAKRFILGTHHSVKYLQSYLDEFSWRFNRRFCNLFERLLNTGLSRKPAYAK